MELWKTNNLFKAFLLSFILAYLASIFLLRNPALSQYLLIVLLAGIILYVATGIVPLLRRKETAISTQSSKTKVSRATLIKALIIILVFIGAFLLVRYETTPTPGYRLVDSQYLVLPNGSTPLSLTAVTPSNECAWLESMNATTQQKARSQGLPDCDFAWPHTNTARPVLFLEYANYTEFIYTINNSSSTPHSSGTSVLCFTIPSQSYQCWVPPATVSNLR